MLLIDDVSPTTTTGKLFSDPASYDVRVDLPLAGFMREIGRREEEVSSVTPSLTPVTPKRSRVCGCHTALKVSQLERGLGQISTLSVPSIDEYDNSLSALLLAGYDLRPLHSVCLHSTQFKLTGSLTVTLTAFFIHSCA